MRIWAAHYRIVHCLSLGLTIFTFFLFFCHCFTGEEVHCLTSSLQLGGGKTIGILWESMVVRGAGALDELGHGMRMHPCSELSMLMLCIIAQHLLFKFITCFHQGL